MATLTRLASPAASLRSISALRAAPVWSTRAWPRPTDICRTRQLPSRVPLPSPPHLGQLGSFSTASLHFQSSDSGHGGHGGNSGRDRSRGNSQDPADPTSLPSLPTPTKSTSFFASSRTPPPPPDNPTRESFPGSRRKEGEEEGTANPKELSSLPTPASSSTTADTLDKFSREEPLPFEARILSSYQTRARIDSK
ncbi:hypothetical protein BGW38_007987, partial [Lunasporangiospora selenospora]